MKRLLIILICFISGATLIAQDNTWFEDITNESGVEPAHGIKINVVDVNNDNYPDLLWGSGGLKAGTSNTFHLFLNAPDPESPNKRKFVDFTEESGINVNRDPNKSWREYDIGVLADVDNDGDVDLVTSFYYHRLEWFTNGHEDRGEVYLNDGEGHFTLKPDAGLYDWQYVGSLEPGMIDAVSISFIDYDYDGALDLYIATKFIDYRYGIYFPDVIMKGAGDGSFVEDLNAGSRAKAEPCYGVNVTDYNNDGWQDVFTSPYCRTSGRLLKNMKDGTFIDYADEANYSSQKMGGDWVVLDPNTGEEGHKPLCQWECPIADFDNDGDMDLLQVEVHGGYQENEGRTHVSINSGAPDYRFEWDLDRIHRDAWSGAHLGDYGGLWFDMDNDGLLDMGIGEGYYTPVTRRLYILKQMEDGEFYDVTAKLDLMHIDDAHSLESIDFDLDGDNDFLVSHTYDSHPQIRLIRNDIGNKNNWVSVKLSEPPPATNLSAIGARIRVYSGNLAQIREIQAGLGHFGGQQPFIRNVGLGSRNYIDSIEVRWPNANLDKTVIYNPPLNMIVNIGADGFAGFVDNWGNEPNPVIHFDRAYLQFDSLNVGDEQTLQFAVKNVGGAELEITSVSLEGDDDGQFSLESPSLPFSLAQNESKTITASFNPKKRAFNAPTVAFESNAHNGETRRFQLYGYGFEVQPMISEIESIRFDTTRYYAEQSFEISNQGETELEINDFAIGGDNAAVFSFETETTPINLAAGESTTVKAKFNPVNRTNYSASATISSNAYNMPETIFSISGRGDTPTPIINIMPPLLNFGKVEPGAVAYDTVKVLNPGDTNLVISNMYFEDGTPEFAVENVEYPLIVEAESDLGVVLSFAPQDDERYNDYLVVISNGFEEEQEDIRVRGTGDSNVEVEETTIIDGNISASVKPNPAMDYAEIEINLRGEAPEFAKIKLIDVSGATVLSAFEGALEPGARTCPLELGSLASGMYYVIIKTENASLRLPLAIAK